MKKVRFQSPKKISSKMNDYECQSPRPFLEKPLEAMAPPICFDKSRILPYSSSPIDRYEQSNSLPVQPAKRTEFKGVCSTLSNCLPSCDLELSMLDGINVEPRQPIFQNPLSKPTFQKLSVICNNAPVVEKELTSKLEQKQNYQPIKSLNDNSFFIKKDNLTNFKPVSLPTNPFKMLSCDKENNPFVIKEAMSKVEIPSLKKTLGQETSHQVISTPLNVQNFNMVSDGDCNCHHCINVMERQMKCLGNQQISVKTCDNVIPQCNKSNSNILNPTCIQHQQLLPPIYYAQKTCNCNCKSKEKPQNAVDKKTWAIEMYEKYNESANMEIEKQAKVSKEKREPTVADLFKIIKLQNEQLQLLQEKVDKFITTGNVRPIDNEDQPLAECIEQPRADSDENKISIGVMTSFEVVCTSTIINKEIVKKCDNTKMQCNRSQISIKEVISKTALNHNVLDGLKPVDGSPRYNDTYRNNSTVPASNDVAVNTSIVQTNLIEEKTLNEQSLINIQVDNATTPQLSPEQTLYLDVRDYSDSDSGSDSQSNVGWTYYNKVMTHVNGMLQDADMPSSASAMYRNMRQQCMQMHIDKTNVSVTKRVQFGEDVLITRPSNNNSPLASTDTSLRMDQLAAKYLKDSTRPFAKISTAAKSPISNDMSLATRNYMERHQLITRHGTPVSAPYTGEMPRFLDITALKQQPKLL